jgi:hypothetical protein
MREEAEKVVETVCYIIVFANTYEVLMERA